MFEKEWIGRLLFAWGIITTIVFYPNLYATIIGGFILGLGANWGWGN